MKRYVPKTLISMILLTSVALLVLSAQVYYNKKGVEKSIKSELNSYLLSQLKFGSTKSFKFTMSNNAGDNIVDNVTFNTERTECILFIKKDKILSRFSSCRSKYPLDQIHDGVHNFSDNAITVKTSFPNNTSIISVLHNSEGVTISNSNVSAPWSLQLFSQNQIFFFVFLAFAYFVLALVYVLMIVNNISQSRKGNIHDYMTVCDENDSISRRLKKATIKRDFLEIEKIRKESECANKIQRAGLYSEPARMKEHDLNSILNVALTGYFRSKNRRTLQYSKSNTPILILADEMYLIRAIVNLIHNAYVESHFRGKVYISTLEGPSYTELIIANDGEIKKPHKIASRGYSTGTRSGRSSGQGVPNIIESLKQMGAEVYYMLTGKKVIASIRLKNSEGA